MSDPSLPPPPPFAIVNISFGSTSNRTNSNSSSNSSSSIFKHAAELFFRKRRNAGLFFRENNTMPADVSKHYICSSTCWQTRAGTPNYTGSTRNDYNTSMRNDYNKNISRNNNTYNSNSSIGSTRNRSNSNSTSNSSITGVLVVLPICSSERDATPVFF